MSFVEGPDGIIVIDPLTSYECAEAAIGLYTKNRESKPVKGLIYTHSHGDHFGGAGKWHSQPIPQYPFGAYDRPMKATDWLLLVSVGTRLT